MASTSRENRRLLTEVELQKEAENIWENETENDIVEDIFGGEDSDKDSNEDYVEEQPSDSDSEQSEIEDEVVDEPVRNIPRLLGKNGHRWSTQPPARQGRTRRENIVLHLPGPKREARTVQSSEQIWNLVFNEQMIDIIILHSNEEITLREIVLNSKTAQFESELENIQGIL
ncbi:hypothetical protein RN001_009487 [Aquatica leii]|uniref:Uncharacterized protein n=1 Tax=Aquatica leii TaxID=1421715 RepID=A0AAN7P8U2_9COLE|nr:hypothetical protein RN001_009487 [Aquatica leii]